MEAEKIKIKIQHDLNKINDAEKLEALRRLIAVFCPLAHICILMNELVDVSRSGCF